MNIIKLRAEAALDRLDRSDAVGTRVYGELAD